MKKLILPIFSFFLVACAPKPEDKLTAVNIDLPASINQSALRHYSPKSQFGANSLTTLSDIDCYAIAVEWDKNQGKCTNSSGTVLAHANMVFGSFPQGMNIELFVPQGAARTFHLYGFSYQDDQGMGCPDFITFPIVDQQQSSKPKLLTSKRVDVFGEVLDITLTRQIAGPDIHTCKSFPFQWESQNSATWDVAVWDQASWQ